MAGALQLGAVGLLAIGTLIAAIATLSNEWAQSDVKGEVLETIRRSWGLWMKCQHVSAGLNTCDHYDRLILGSPTELILSRAFMLIGVLLGTVGIVVMLAGADCATVVKNPRQKKKIRCVGGIMGLSAGALILITGCLIAVIITKDFHHNQYMVSMQQGGSSWGRRRRAADDGEIVPASDDYINSLHDEIPKENELFNEDGSPVKHKGERFSSMRNDGQRMVFGVGVFLALGSGIMILIAGGLMLSQGCGGTTYEEENDFNDGYSQGQNTYPAAQKTRNNEYL